MNNHEVPKRKLNLSPEGLNLKALLSALDEAQKDMSPKEKDAMNQRIVKKEEEFAVSPEEMARRRSAIRIAELNDSSIEEGEKNRRDLEEASKLLEKPGIQNLLDLLGQPKLHGEGEAPEE